MTGISGWNTAMKGRDGLNNKSTRQGQALSGAFVMQSAVHGAAVGGGARRWARTWIISPAMLTAISSGVTARMGVPMGVCTRSMEDWGMPASSSRWFTDAVFRREPMTPT